MVISQYNDINNENDIQSNKYSILFNVNEEEKWNEEEEKKKKWKKEKRNREMKEEREEEEIFNSNIQYINLMILMWRKVIIYQYLYY